MLREAGFVDIEVEQIPGVMTVADLDDYWVTLSRLAGPVKATVDQLSDDERAAVRAALAGMMAPFQACGRRVHAAVRARRGPGVVAQRVSEAPFRDTDHPAFGDDTPCPACRAVRVRGRVAR